MVAGLGDSPVPLDQDVVKRKPLTVSPTFMEWVSDGNAEQIWEVATKLGVGTSIMFTVPAKSTFFLTSAYISAHSIAGAGVHGFAELKNGSTFKQFLAVMIDHDNAAAPTVNTAALSFPMPLRFNAGDTVEISVQSLPNGQAKAAIFGFLLPLKISIR